MTLDGVVADGSTRGQGVANSGHGIVGFGSVSGCRRERSAGSRGCWLEEETDEGDCWDGLLGERAEARKGSGRKGPPGDGSGAQTRSPQEGRSLPQASLKALGRSERTTPAQRTYIQFMILMLKLPEFRD